MPARRQSEKPKRRLPMNDHASTVRLMSVLSSLVRFRIWHLALLVAYTGIAIVDVQTLRRNEPTLIALVSAGYLAYGLCCWVGWHLIRHFQPRLALILVFSIYAVTMATIFLGATIVYLIIEYAYLGGRFF
jgi:hypothetical protein